MVRDSLLAEARQYRDHQRRRRFWKKIVSVLGCAVVFCTTYALILPAITMEQETICGLEEHIHDESCWSTEPQASARLICTEEQLGLHRHDAGCYDENGLLVCGQADFVLHTHDESCYDSAGALVCPLPEIRAHIHDESCCEQPHVHSDGCYTLQQGELLCTVTEGTPHVHSDGCFTETRELACTQAEEPGHRHTADCYAGTARLTCPLEETPGHIHGADCRDETGALICNLEEYEGHTHGDSCYTPEQTLTCPLQETEGHTHGDACYQTVTIQVCPLAEGEPHVHTDACYQWTPVLTCQLPLPGEDAQPRLVCDLPEVVPHIHAETCFDADGSCICGLLQVEEHVHGQRCFLVAQDGERQPVLCCGLEEHIHTESCYPAEEQPVLTPGGEGEIRGCGLAEHLHGDGCYSLETGTLLCTMPEHLHSEECDTLPGEPEDGITELSYSGGDYTVSVVYGPEAGLPQGVTLLAEEILPDTEEYREYYTQSVEALDPASWSQPQTLVFARFFDVWFELDGEVYEPEAPVSVTITYDDGVEIGRTEECQAIHFAEDGLEILEVDTEDSRDGATSFTHTQDGFSVVGSLVTTTAYSLENPADAGPDKLPVDYYVCIDGEWTCVGSTKTGWYYKSDTDGLTNYNRDYITVEQAVSILGLYGFTGNENKNNPSRVTAYQQKSGHLNIYSDTDTVSVSENAENGEKILPLSRNSDHAGYNLYYIPANTAQINGVASPDRLDTAANAFYTVKVYDTQGKRLTSENVKTGGSFNYDAAASGITSWLVSYGDGRTETVSTIALSNITSTVTVSPKQNSAGELSHSVTFKVMIDGQWQTVGSLPYYYTGDFNGSQRAYITSDMAAQFFGDFGYTAATDPGYHFGYSYNDIYKIYYAANTGYCMDINGNTIANNTAVQLWTPNTSTAQIFRIWDVSDGYSYITPVENSAYHVNVLGGGTVDGTKLGIHTATDAASHWKVVSNGDGTTSFYNRNAPNSAVIDLPSGNVTPGNQLQIWNNGGYRYWKLVQQYRISNSTISERNADGTWNIGLTPESNGDIVCYYMPAETASTYADAAESAISTANSFWSVSVRDDTNSVYSDGELSGMVQIVKPGGEATVTVRNADGILWGCRDVNGEAVEVGSTIVNGNTISFIITNITQPIEVVASHVDPNYTVQYYAWMDVAADNGAKALDVIDTSGGKLPGNYAGLVNQDAKDKPAPVAPSPAGLSKIYLNDNGTLATTSKLLEVYSAKDYEYVKAPDLAYVNKLEENEHYTLKELWVLKPDRDPASTAKTDWTVYEPTVSFVNYATESSDEIWITDDTVIRLVFEETKGFYTNGANFYDYDITDGSRVEKYDSSNSMSYVVTQTAQYGINSSGNYSGSGTKLAFGNRNTGMSLQDAIWGQNFLNHFNANLPSPDPGYGLNMKETHGYKGCTFGLVTSLKSDGTIQYVSGVDVPKLFNESGTVTGKTSFDNGQFSLQFNRVGDTYTLSAVNTASGATAAGTLDQFDDALGSNNFWPMDSASTWGASGHDLKFGSSSLQHARRYNTGGYWSCLPVSDDGQDHNSYFGMQYAVNFNLTADYTGPLEYYFYGDDDMWVFLDNRLVCDIGGVHSTVGEYVDLWDYIQKGDEGSHTLTFFYTERGASGSTCYMRFTLPSVSNATLSKYHGDLQIAKSVSADGYEDVSYQFQVDLLTKKVGGSPIGQTCRYMITSLNGESIYGTVKSGGIVTLKAGETATISGIPAGTYYCVTELTTDGYKTTVNGKEGYIVSGEIANGEIQNANFVNTPYYELPSTGGNGTVWYSAGGLCLMAAAVLLYGRIRSREKERRSSP